MFTRYVTRAGLAVALAIWLGACSSGSHSTSIVPAVDAARTQTAAGTLNAAQRPISEFINAQGTFCFPESGGVPPGATVVNGCVIFVPPVLNFEGWGTPKSTPQCPTGIQLAAVDYAGLANKYLIQSGDQSLGTTMSGTITERPLSDGTAQVVVNLQTKNALAWAGCDPNGTTFSFNFATATVLFGNRAAEVANGAQAALASSHLQLVFTEPNMGAPMPDLLQLLAAPVTGQSLITMKFYATADGLLQSAFGVPAGTPGHLVVAETATLHTTGKAAADAFTAEEIHITAK